MQENQREEREPSKITTDGSKNTLKESAKTGICIAERMLGKKYHYGVILWYQIISRSVDIQHTQILQYNDQVAETREDILALWQKYFQDLSNPDFDYEKYDLSHIQNAIIEKNEKGKL